MLTDAILIYAACISVIIDFFQVLAGVITRSATEPALLTKRFVFRFFCCQVCLISLGVD